MVPPKDRTQKWEAVSIPAEPTVHRMKWIGLISGGWALAVAPLHGRGTDGDPASKIRVYHPPADPHRPWKVEELEGSMHATHNLEVLRDIDATYLYVAGREGVVEQRYGGFPTTRRQVTTRPAGEVRLWGLTRLPHGTDCLATN
jgi:hypothetical protein